MTRRRLRRRLISICLSLIVIGVGWAANEYPARTQQIVGPPPSGTYRVIKFDDGDTISVDMNGNTEKIRLIGVDTPETHDPRKVVQCFGQAASEFTKQLVNTQSVRLEADSLSSNRDRYGRLLRYVYLPDGKLVNAEIIKEGFGFAYISFPFTKSDEFSNYQAQARSHNLGLWSTCQPTENQYGGFTSSNAN